MAAIEEVMEMPEDVLTEILSRAPVKSLLRCKSVSKHWYYLIQNPTFISHHHNRARSNDCIVLARQRIIRGQVPDTAFFSMYLVPPDHHHQTSSSSPLQQLNLPSFSTSLHNDDNVVKAIFLLGCHNGLMCLAHDITSSIVIFNPATRESRLLPPPLYESKHRSYLGFTFDPRANDYKVIRFCLSLCRLLRTVRITLLTSHGLSMIATAAIRKFKSTN
ncbi:hypothetical protein RHMOL_Rhmol06G0037500 [Rhododendron molle]|uniref:Uncharacterized protein n=1 Tax=Rhododendron molle TaxID=49168 RepID=A0ACC0N8S5_RHOML|nr:hypothetical protein RHMOL_Rhmol06G0037500 [Rhododendron molle]